jgi:hypothetical protein
MSLAIKSETGIGQPKVAESNGQGVDKTRIGKVVLRKYISHQRKHIAQKHNSAIHQNTPDNGKT